MKKQKEQVVSDTHVTLPIEKYNLLLKNAEAVKKPMKHRFWIGRCVVPVIYETDDESTAALASMLVKAQSEKNDWRQNFERLDKQKSQEIADLKKLNFFQFYFWKHGKYKGDFTKSFMFDMLKLVLIVTGLITFFGEISKAITKF